MSTKIITTDFQMRPGDEFALRDRPTTRIHGAAQRVRSKIMTVMAIILDPMPVMWVYGTGSEAVKRIAAPIVGGLVTSRILTLLIFPAVHVIWKCYADLKPERLRIRRRSRRFAMMENTDLQYTYRGYMYCSHET